MSEETQPEEIEQPTRSVMQSWWAPVPYDVAVVLPTRGRTDQLKKSLLSLMDKATEPEKVQYLIGIDNDDTSTIEWINENLIPVLREQVSPIKIIQFDRLGYGRLNEYVSHLARHSVAEWIMFWNDDAIMETDGWDRKIAAETGEFNVLRMPTHNEHPYAIFPIVPRDWLYLFGRLSPHQLSDAWISQVAFMLNRMKNIDVGLVHDRADLTGNNDDETYQERVMYEGNPDDPKDFNHRDWYNARLEDCQKLAWYLHSRGYDMTWWEGVLNGKQDPWERMHTPEFDPNQQVGPLRKTEDGWKVIHDND